MTPLQAIKNHGWADTLNKAGATAVACGILYLVIVSIVKPMAEDAIETQKMLRAEIPKQTEISRQVLENQQRSTKTLDTVVETGKKVAENQTQIIGVANKQVDALTRQTEILDRFSGESKQDHKLQLEKIDGIDRKLPAKP